MKMIVLNSDQKAEVEGIYNNSFQLAPEFVEADKYALPLEVLSDDNFIEVRGILSVLPQEDINRAPITIPEGVE